MRGGGRAVGGTKERPSHGSHLWEVEFVRPKSRVGAAQELPPVRRRPGQPLPQRHGVRGWAVGCARPHRPTPHPRAPGSLAWRPWLRRLWGRGPPGCPIPTAPRPHELFCICALCYGLDLCDTGGLILAPAGSVLRLLVGRPAAPERAIEAPDGQRPLCGTWAGMCAWPHIQALSGVWSPAS